jgi:hypothetical protein
MKKRLEILGSVIVELIDRTDDVAYDYSEHTIAPSFLNLTNNNLGVKIESFAQRMNCTWGRRK